MYDKYLKVNDKFKPSINLSYDLNNPDKIIEFVPTTDLCDIIKKYINSILDENSNKATLLSGPYGKGKSYLILVIIYILSKRKNRKVFTMFLSKVEVIDKELASLIKQIDDEKKSLLPIVINSNESTDMNQNFMLALNNALNDAKIKNVIPNSTFDECLDVIFEWEKSCDFHIVKDCANKMHLKLDDLKLGLRDYSMKAYHQFCDFYKCVTHGAKFNPLVGNDISLIYEGVARNLKKHGFLGVFVVFDEFGVFLENQYGDFAVRLNKMQALAEKANSSNADGQLHLCCITHKDIQLYKNENHYMGEFEKIAGRFEQIRFDRSLEENYQIICGAITKSNKYIKLIKEAKKQHSYFIDELKSAAIFNDESQVDYIIDNGYPLNPVTLYSLVQISEKVAQNERTLFTYIADNDSHGFKYFVANNVNGMVNVDSLYDYFEDSIKENPNFKSIYFKAESLIRSVLKEIERAIIKSVAISKIINDNVKFLCTPQTIALCLGKRVEEVEVIIDDLINTNKLKKNINDGSIDFALLASDEINTLIERTIKNIISRQNISELLSRFDKNKYFVSHRYNFEKSITRFYEAIYFEASDFIDLESSRLLFEKVNSDGLLVNLINNNNVSLEKIKENIDSENLLVRVIEGGINNVITEKIYQVFAIEKLLEKSKDFSDSIIESLYLLHEDSSHEVQRYLNRIFSNSAIVGHNLNEYNNLNDAIYRSLNNTYLNMVVFNNEQVNKNEISPVITKARNTIINNLLNITNTTFTKTSAEATIQNSFEDSLKNSDEIVAMIRDMIINCRDDRVNASYITNTLTNPPFGMRKGVIPLFLAYVINLLKIKEDNCEENVIFYNGNIEVDLNATNLTKMMIEPSNFTFSYKRINRDRLEMMKELNNVLQLNTTSSFVLDANQVVNKLKHYVSNLEPILVKSSKRDNILHLENNEMLFKDILLKRDLNAFDLLTNELPEKLKVAIKSLPKEIVKIQNSYKTRVESFYKSVIDDIQKVFIGSCDSICTSYNLWKSNHSYITNIIFEPEYKRIYQVLENSEFNDFDTINALSYATINSTLNDFNTSKLNDFEEIIANFANFVENYEQQESVSKEEFDTGNDEKLSNLGNTLYTNIHEVIEEYGFSISNEEKALILKKLIKEIVD